ncbi:hypothetical protein F3Y22_tig00000340pilonHSYRG01447 [Hibiscus syriacus]|uniref:Pre-SET domain-containing protein n=1 Tax=Hibiscus syriacus TaxID=106335 RepID=A0A6A3D502_HIBSY|nr:hypothetical protein F3Y22_tig00000340pilonHSYRG01447 [Hibiscus syriacus]
MVLSLQVSPFVPISGPQGSHSTPDLDRNGVNSTAMPIRLFRTENLSQMDARGSQKQKSVGSSSDKKKAKVDKSSKLSFTASCNFDTGISLSERDDDNRELVENVLLRFDALRRKLSQMEDRMESHSSIIKRADLKAGNTMMSKGVRTNMKKRIGAVAGVEIRDIFFFRMELCLVGLHSQSIAGIDYIKGGNAGRDKEASDQKLEKGNLALEKSLHRGKRNPRVMDGEGKIRVGLILPNLTSSAESTPVSLVNEVDDEKGPAYLTYFPTVKYLKSFNLVQSTVRCDCRDACQPGKSSCSCLQKNEGDYPYTANGVLVCRKPLIYECGPSCPCVRNCKNRVSQTGLKFHLEVFKSRDRGWGLWSRDPIRPGCITVFCRQAKEVWNPSYLVSSCNATHAFSLYLFIACFRDADYSFDVASITCRRPDNNWNHA